MSAGFNNRVDIRIFKKLIRFFERKKISTGFPDQLVLEIGKFFLGMPYLTATLEPKKAEHLIINLRAFDCVTFIENVVAFVWLIESGEKTFRTFGRLLQKIRYREGQLKGYYSRLHYFSDWINDNQKKGILKDVTAEIGGRPLRKTINFMTTNPELYPQLKNAVCLSRMKDVEKVISRIPLSYIPKKALRRLENRICDGDLIAITTNTEGLDVHHVGFAAKVKNRVHLLHVSSLEGKVVFSPKTLYQYLMQSRVSSGIIVARISIPVPGRL